MQVSGVSAQISVRYSRSGSSNRCSREYASCGGNSVGASYQPTVPRVDSSSSRGPLEEVERFLEGPRSGAERSGDAPVFRQAGEATEAPA